MSYQLPHASFSHRNADIKSNIKEKILYFHENYESPAVKFLLSNINKFSEKIKPKDKIPKYELLLPKLKQQLFQYKTLNNSIDSTLNNSIETTQVNISTQARLKIKDITAKSLISPDSSDIHYLEGVESEVKKSSKIYPFHNPSERKSIKVDRSISHVNKSIRSFSYQPSIANDLSLIQRSGSIIDRSGSIIDRSGSIMLGSDALFLGSQHKLFVEKLAEYDNLKQLCNAEEIILINYFQNNQGNILRALNNRDYERLIQIIAGALEICQEINNVRIFSECVLYLGGLCIDCEQINKASFFLEQTLIICEYTRDHQLKLKVLQQLAVCAMKLQLYQQAIELLKKSLVYAWITNNFEKEILFNDMLGLNHFYNGDVKQALFFHEKYTLAELEPQGGYFRKTSQKLVEYYEQTIKYFSENITKTFMLKLSLPIKNIFEFLPNQDNPTCDQFKIIRYNTCDGITIIDNIIKGVEYTEFFLDYYQTDKNPQKKVKPRIQKRERLPKRIIEIQQKYSDHKSLYNFSHNICENELYKIPLDIRAQFRIEQDNEIEKVWMKVKRSIGQTREPYGDKKEQIYMKHVKESKGKKEELNAFLKRHKELLNCLIVSIADIKN